MKHILLAPLFAMLVLSCGKDSESSDKAVSSSPAFAVEREAFYRSLLAPTEVAAQLASAAEFNPALMNSPTIYSLYARQKLKAAANLGVYLSDLNYSIAYSQKTFIKEYFESVNALSKAVGIQEQTLQFLLKRYQDNISRNDSIKKVMTDLLTASTQGLQTADKEELAGVAMAGYQIENLYIVLGIIKAYPHILPKDAEMRMRDPLSKIILNQKPTIETTYRFLLRISDPLNPHKNPNYPFYVKSFEELINVLGKLKETSTSSELMNDELLEELSEKVNTIRTKIVSTE